MPPPNVLISVDRIMELLGLLDNQFCRQETKVAGEWSIKWPNRDLAICAMFLQDNVSQPAESACILGQERMRTKRVELTMETQQRFVTILRRVVRAQDGISRQERAFLGQFWWELQRSWTDTRFTFR